MTAVLFSSAGRRVGLMDCFRASARDLGMEIRVVATDCNPALSAACRAADGAFQVPRCTEPAFIPELLEICRREKVRLIVPTIDPELDVLAAHREEFEAAGTRVAVSSPVVIGACRNKIETSRFLTTLGIRTPRTGRAEEIFQDVSGWNFPVILKPVRGSSSIGIATVSSPEELREYKGLAETHIVQELWRGREYTVNMFFDGERFRCAVPHWRVEIRAGEVSKGRTERVEALLQAARALGSAWAGQAFGALCFQAILDERGDAAVFEINGRFGGGYPLAHEAGGQFAKWLLEIVTGRPCTAHEQWRENVLMLRYDAAIFRDEPAS